MAMAASDILDRGAGHIHCIGVCGVGMAGVAYLLRAGGFEVSGCDAARGRLGPWLEQRGIATAVGHDPDHLRPDMLAVVRSAAVTDREPELQRARALDLPVLSRGAMLAALVCRRRTAAVCGTHGKTTTSSFLAWILERAALGPSWCIGGETELANGVMGVAEPGVGDLFVVEADESDGTLALYAPEWLVINNVEFDHMEHFGGPAEFEACFLKAIEQTRRETFFCVDDAGARRLCAGRERTRGFGFSADADLRAEGWDSDGISQRFTLSVQGRAVTDIVLPLPGRHNALNALAAAGAAMAMGVTADRIADALRFARLPLRRFQKIVDRPDLLVVSDYAHHPSEIAALVRTAASRRCIAVFQPHRYTRTLQLGSDFAPAFDGVHEAILLPVYAASEQPLPGGSHWDLYARMRADCAQEGYKYRLLLARSFSDIEGYVPNALLDGDALLIVGAGDVEKLVPWARAVLGDDDTAVLRAVPASLCAACPHAEFRQRETLADKTTLKIGGKADLWVEVREAAWLPMLLAAAFREGVRLRVLGAGSNVLASDLGVDGLVLRLAACAFGKVQARPHAEGGGDLICGAAAPLVRVLDRLTELGWSGLQFLEGVPGTVGGALAMNAGAHGAAIGDFVAGVRGYTAEGREFQMSRNELRFDYRSCPGLRNKIITEAVLRCPAGRADRVLEQRRSFAEARAWMRGLRTAGSAFLNPPGAFAGRLLEESGFKGRRVGGASFSERHANVLVAESGAAASDALALLEMARDTVRRRFNIELQPEIRFWGR